MPKTERKARGDAILKTLGDALQEEFFQLLRTTTQAKALAWLEQAHGIKVSAGAATAFWQWYPRQLVLRRAARSSDSLEAAINKMPQLRVSADQARAVAQINFELQAAEDRDAKLFGMLGAAALKRERQQLEREKFEWAKKSEAEKGLEALFLEVKDCPAALKHFEAMKAALQEAKA